MDTVEHLLKLRLMAEGFDYKNLASLSSVTYMEHINPMTTIALINTALTAIKHRDLKLETTQDDFNQALIRLSSILEITDDFSSLRDCSSDN